MLLIIALDQGTKWLVRHDLAVGESWAPIPALSKIFTITHVQNTGVAFGQLPGLGWLFMVVNLVVLAVVLIYYPRIPAGQWPTRLASILILGGDLGNIIDRLRTTLHIAQDIGSVWTALPKASVTDFFDFQIWPVFNIADMCLVGGIVVLALVLWRQDQTRAVDDQLPLVKDQ
ncbi:MAG: signal peptidase II [Anaerolineae bacterium]|nr:signal peptidase II [Anaerolineae bacterium]